MSNMKDVAKLAGVSIATVSNYINQTRNVKPDTARKIERAISELNYLPDTRARSLKMGTAKEIGVILPTIDDSYYSLVLKGLERKFNEYGYVIQVAFTENSIDKENEALDRLLSKSRAGLVLVTSQPDNTKFFAKKLSTIPYVLLDRKIKGLDSNLIVFDNYRTIKHLVNNMIAIGKKRIALITGDQHYYSEKECIKGYKSAFKSANIPINDNYIIETDFSKEEAFKNIIKLLEENQIDCVITSATATALGALEAVYIRRVKNLDNINIICLGEEIWNRHSNLIGIETTMRTPYNMGVEAAKLLIDNIKKPVLFEKKTYVLPDRITTKKNLSYRVDKIYKINFNKAKISKSIHVLLLKGPGTTPIRGLLPNFIYKNHINVKITEMDQKDIYGEIIKDAKKDVPDYDVYMYDIPWLEHLAAHGCLYDITQLCIDNKIKGEQFLPGISKSFCEYDSKVYGLPYIYGPQILFYRKDLFDDPQIKEQFLQQYKIKLEPPKSWLEFNTIAKFFTKKYNPKSATKYGTIIANDSSYRLCPEFYMRLWAFGGQIIDETGRILKHTDAYKKAMRSLAESFKYSDEKGSINTLEDTVKRFSRGEAAMLVSYTTYIPDINNRFMSNVAGKIGYSIVPGSIPVLSGWSLGGASKTKNIDEAFKFINWVCGEELQDYFAILKGTSPMEKVYENDDIIKMYPWFDVLYNMINYCKARRFPAGKNIDDNIQIKVEKEITNDIIRYIKECEI